MSFLMYINDLSDNMLVLTRLFAEDTIIYSLIASTDDYKTLLEDLRLEQRQREWNMDFILIVQHAACHQK